MRRRSPADRSVTSARAVRLGALAAGLSLLAACAGAPRVSLNQATPPPHPHELAQVIAGQDVPVAVAASPFPGVTPLQLATIVAADMPSLCMAHYHPVAAISGWGITWSFGMDGAGELQGDARLDGLFRSPLSEVLGYVTGAARPDDPAFAALVHQMTLGLMIACGYA